MAIGLGATVLKMGLKMGKYGKKERRDAQLRTLGKLTTVCLLLKCEGDGPAGLKARPFA
jgi:hypothetical protein